MVKKILILFIFLSLYAAAQTPIEAGISYNEASARIEAFKNVELKLDKDFLKEHLTDKNKKENLESIEKKILIIKDKRQLCPFYLKKTLVSYAVSYLDKPEYTFYYNALGSLIKAEIIKGDDYPKKSIGYTRYGNLISIAFEINNQEQFVYDKNGKLIAHWLDNKVTNETKTDKLLNKFKFQRGLLE